MMSLGKKRFLYICIIIMIIAGVGSFAGQVLGEYDATRRALGPYLFEIVEADENVNKTLNEWRTNGVAHEQAENANFTKILASLEREPTLENLEWLLSYEIPEMDFITFFSIMKLSRIATIQLQLIPVDEDNTLYRGDASRFILRKNAALIFTEQENGHFIEEIYVEKKPEKQSHSQKEETENTNK